MMVWRNSVTCTPDERKELRNVLYLCLTKAMEKDDPKRKKYLRMYKAFKNADERQKEDDKGR
jgi:hypothetical protein